MTGDVAQVIFFTLFASRLYFWLVPVAILILHRSVGEHAVAYLTDHAVISVLISFKLKPVDRYFF